MPWSFIINIEKEFTLEEFASKCVLYTTEEFGDMFFTHGFSKPLPRKVELPKYNLKKQKKAEKKLEEIMSMSTEQIAQIVESEYMHVLKYHNNFIVKKQELTQKYNNLLQQVYAWQPPSKNFKHVKEFMIEHLQTAMANDFDLKDRQPPEKESAENYRARQIKEIQEEIKDQKQNYAWQIKNVKMKNDFLQLFYSSFNQEHNEDKK